MLELKGKYCKDCKVFNDEIEDEALSTIHNILNLKEYADAQIRIMPDVHQGKNAVIGFTALITNAICPSTVGVDVGCTIDTWITDLPIDSSKFELIEHRIKKEVPFGFNINDKRTYEMKDFIRYIKNYYNKARASWSEMILDMEISEKSISAMLKRIGMDEGIFYKSIPSCGSGNHFVELGDYQGVMAFTIHCGSRNLGQKVCKYWEKVAANNVVDKQLLKDVVKEIKATTSNRKEIPLKIEEWKKNYEAKRCSNGYLDGDLMKGYLTDMVIATAYALFNHEMIAKRIIEILKKIHDNHCEVTEVVRSTHNYVDFEDHIIRKGAIRAYEGEKMVVPFNMRDGLAICVGKSNKDWNCSCSHGAGRKMSRNKAKELLSMDEFKNTMKGVYSTTVCQSTIDEAPMAYKNTETIIDLIQDTCDIICMVKPLINIKAIE